MIRPTAEEGNLGKGSFNLLSLQWNSIRLSNLHKCSGN